jgi:hypothetical protein
VQIFVLVSPLFFHVVIDKVLTNPLTENGPSRPRKDQTFAGAPRTQNLCFR